MVNHWFYCWDYDEHESVEIYISRFIAQGRNKVNSNIELVDLQLW